MEIILREDVDKLGLRGEVVSVADGYARNFLIPRRLAERATPAKVAELRKRDEQRARQEARTAEQAEELASVLGKTVLRFDVAAGPTGRLFGSVTPTNIADEIWRTRKIRVDRRKIRLEEPIKRIGRYGVAVHLFEGVDVEVKTLVAPEGGELPTDEELAAMEAEERAAEAEAAGEPEAEVLPEAAAELTGEAEPEAGAEPEVGVVEPPAAEEQVPDDAFDRAVDTAVETPDDDGARG